MADAQDHGGRTRAWLWALGGLVVVLAIALVAYPVVVAGLWNTSLLFTLGQPRPVLASIAFTAVHGALWMMPPIFVLSLCLGYAYHRTRNLWVSIIVHACFNAASIVVFLYGR